MMHLTYPIMFTIFKQINYTIFTEGFVNLFTLYITCDLNTVMHHHDFNNLLSCIYMYCLQHNVEYCILGGDFNTDISRVNSMNTTALQNFA